MEIEQPEIKRLATLSSLIESNCEYLTCIKNMAIQRNKMQRDSIKTLDNYMQDASKNQTKTKLHFEELVQLIIELAYFLYSCKNFQKKPEIELDDIRVEENYLKSGEKRFNIVVFYRLSEESIEENLASILFKSILEHIEQALHDYIQNRKQNQQTNNSGDSEYEAAFDTFWKQFQQIAQNEVLAEDEVKFFLYLEQTSLFYEYSLLYRIKNCSLLDYIRINPNRTAIFKQFKEKEQSLLNNYQQEKKRLRGDQEVLKAKEKEIDKNVENFFEKINDNNIEPLHKNEKDQSNKVKFNFKLKEKQKNLFEQLLANLQGESAMSEEGKKDLKRPLAELQYFVEFSAQRNSICVKLFLPSIVVNVETSDFLMFQSNVLTFDAANVTIQLSQPKLKTEEKVPKKVVTFKGTSSFNSSNTKQPLLPKILLLMDITMIASRIYEPEMSSQKYVQGGKESYQKLNNISKKVSHYTKLFMICAKKVYDQ